MKHERLTHRAGNRKGSDATSNMNLGFGHIVNDSIDHGNHKEVASTDNQPSSPYTRRKLIIARQKAKKKLMASRRGSNNGMRVGI